jgi:hypothetical protein
MAANRFIVMRAPCLPEDEGRHFVEKVGLTKQEAEEWIAAQAEEYFKPSDYYIVDAPN